MYYQLKYYEKDDKKTVYITQFFRFFSKGNIIGIIENMDEKEKEKMENIKMQERRAMHEK